MQDDTLADMIGQAGGLDDSILEIVAINGTSSQWAVRFAQLDLLITNLPEERMIGFSAVIDGPAAEQRLAFYMAMLSANALWRSTGGLRFALSPDGNGVEISMALAAVDVTPRLITDCCLALAGHTASWALLVAGQTPAAQSDHPSPDFDPTLLRL